MKQVGFPRVLCAHCPVMQEASHEALVGNVGGVMSCARQQRGRDQQGVFLGINQESQSGMTAWQPASGASRYKVQGR
jgi:hypothetical protein